MYTVCSLQQTFFFYILGLSIPVPDACPSSPHPLHAHFLLQSLGWSRLHHPHTGTHTPITHPQGHTQGLHRRLGDGPAELGKSAGATQDPVSSPSGVWVPPCARDSSCSVPRKMYVRKQSLATSCCMQSPRKLFKYHTYFNGRYDPI